MSSFLVLWLHRGDPEALKLMSEITQHLKEKERKQPEETVFAIRIYKK